MNLRRFHVIAFLVGFAGAAAYDVFGGTIQELSPFPTGVGPQPNAYANGVTVGSDGGLYGTTANGGSGSGNVFRFTSSGGFVNLTNFPDPGAYSSQAPLAQGTDGAFYGTTTFGGAAGNGTVFRVTTNGTLTTVA